MKRFSCPHCKGSIAAKQTAHSRAVLCPKCNKRLVVPGTMPQIKPPPPPPPKQEVIRLAAPPPVQQPDPPAPTMTFNVDQNGTVRATWTTTEEAQLTLDNLDDTWQAAHIYIKQIKEQIRQSEQEYKRNNRATGPSPYSLGRGKSGQTLRLILFAAKTVSGMSYAAQTAQLEQQVRTLTTLKHNVELTEIQVRSWLRSHGISVKKPSRPSR
jgi:DNA-directed RNA polymerase subunit RPC12/RpoP